MLKQSDYIFLTQLNVSINNILVFSAVMNTGGLLPASYFMNCSQSAVSLSLKKFCACFPTRLFHRDGRRLIPTNEAHEIYNNISPVIINLMKVMQEAMTEAVSEEKSHITHS